MTRVELPSELWNLVVLVVLFALSGWVIRLLNLAFVAIDLRHALKSGSTIYLNDLGPSLMLLSCASLRHFEQLMRISYEPIAVPMQQIQVPFELLTGSLRLDDKDNNNKKNKNNDDDDNKSTKALVSCALASNPSALSLNPLQDQSTRHQELSFCFHAKENCLVQVFWGVRTVALEQINLLESCSLSPLGSTWSCGRTPSGRRRRDVLQFIQNVGLFPKLIMQRFFGDETNLLGEHVQENSSSSEPHERRREPDPLNVLDVLDEDMVESKSMIYQFAAGESLEFRTTAASITLQANAMDPELPLEEKVEASDHVDPDPEVAVESQVVRYPAVVAFSSLDAAMTLQDAKEPCSPTTKKGKEDDKVLCHLVAIDFLPTPIKATPFAPVVIKRFDFTRTKCFIPYDIYGSEAATTNECVICLEKKRTATLLPCRHLCVCQTCLEEIDRCPICRTKFNMYTCYTQDDTVDPTTVETESSLPVASTNGSPVSPTMNSSQARQPPAEGNVSPRPQTPTASSIQLQVI